MNNKDILVSIKKDININFVCISILLFALFFNSLMAVRELRASNDLMGKILISNYCNYGGNYDYDKNTINCTDE